jgi:hypothetical protein
MRAVTAAAVALAVVAGLSLDASAQGRGGRGGGVGRGGRGGGLIPPLHMKTDAFEDRGIIPERYAGRGGSLPEGTVSGTARVGRGSYFGPGAPAGPRYHHDVFELDALSATLNLPADAARAGCSTP